MNRIKAALAHLSISIVVFALFLSLVFFIWYAYPFNITQGVAEIVYLMAFIDVVLGPLLTFIVFKVGKKSLKFDLSVIGFVQIAALIYGGYIIYSERPAWITFASDRFEVVGLQEIDSSKLPDKALNVGIFDKPKFVYAERPVGEKGAEIMFQAVAGGKDFDRVANQYRSFESNIDKVMGVANSFEDHSVLSKESSSEGLSWLAVKGKHKTIIAIFDIETKKVVDYRLISPW